jgi:GH24 family phage-related lysozyme (muramidase)
MEATMANRWLELERSLESKQHVIGTWVYAHSSTIPAGALARAKRTEGNLDHLYLDTAGYVTVGVGHMLPVADAAAKLAFRRDADDAPASAQEIKDEFAAVAAEPKGKLASYYKQVTKLHLAQTAIDELLTADLERVIGGVKGDFPDYDAYPEGVREAIIDMAFNLGNAGLVGKFPKFVALIRKKDWKAAAKESHRQGIAEWRNEEIKQLLNDAS